MTAQVYLPVVVTFGDAGNVVEVAVDFEGAPWMYTDSTDNIWTDEPALLSPEHDTDEFSWVANEERESDAITWLEQILENLDYEDA